MTLSKETWPQVNIDKWAVQPNLKWMVKVGFSQKVMAKFFILSNCHSCEPKIVPALLIPVKDNNKILAILWIDLDIKSPHYKIWPK